MFSLESLVDLPLLWFGILAIAIFLYILLDGFDLGVGILFPYAPSDRCRDRMMNSVAPFWDGNETWLVLGGGGLLAAFPLAFAILMPATHLAKSTQIAERLRRAISRCTLPIIEGGLRFTVSVGVAQIADADNLTELRSRCERSLEAALEVGGNRTSVHDGRLCRFADDNEASLTVAG